VFNGEPVELLEESTWTARLRRTGYDVGKEVLCCNQENPSPSSIATVYTRTDILFSHANTLIIRWLALTFLPAIQYL